MELTEREYEVVTNIWGDETPGNLSQIDTDRLVAMHDQISRAIQASYDDDDVESLGILLPLEKKVVSVLYSRL